MRGNQLLLDHAEACIHLNSITGLIGANGCGKSSLFDCISGELASETGTCNLPTGMSISRVLQETPNSEASALDYIIDGDREYRRLHAELHQAMLNDDAANIARLHEALEHIDAWSMEARAAALLSGLGFPAATQRHSVRSFSGGWRMRLNLARALLARGDLLLLDEPTNHLDLDALIWLEAYLKKQRNTLLIISHDRDFLDHLCQYILLIDNKKIHSFVGNYSDYRKQEHERRQLAEAQYRKNLSKREHLQSYVDRFRYKATKAKQAQSRLKALEKISVEAPLPSAQQVEFEFLEPTYVPPYLLQCKEMDIGYEQALVHQVTLNINAGDRIALLGRNGAGKSTLIKTLAGVLSPLSGHLHVSPQCKIAYFAQHQLDALRADKTPLAHMQVLDPQSNELQLRAYLGQFAFHGDDVLRPVADFSGGEKARLALALLVYQRPNLLLLDEPTNHLDIGTREGLTIALQNFNGAMLIISHDRYLLRACADQLYLIEQGKLSEFKGDLEDYHRYLLQPPVESSTPAPRMGRKEEKQRAAEWRRRSQPMRNKLKELEKDLEHISTELAEIHQQMAQEEFYQRSSAEVNALLQREAALQKKNVSLEDSWLECSAELETFQ